MQSALILNPKPGWAPDAFERLPPGGHVFVLGATGKPGYEARGIGFELRDTILILGKPIRLALLLRKPVSGTVVENVLKHGTGGINIGACRIGTEQRVNAPASTIRVETMGRPEGVGSGWRANHPSSVVSGRWPPNVLLSHLLVARLDEQSGISHSPASYVRSAPGYNLTAYGKNLGEDAGKLSVNYADAGGASRFFPQFKTEAELHNWLCTLITPEG
jgi:site-specific DNA-methyltransferase (adenine-specific)